MFDYSPLNQIEFKAWPKIPRSQGNAVTVTEKMDGTNACVIIRSGVVVGAQSRNRLIKPGDDNMGFALFVSENHEALTALGDGYHYGEWVGPGIQKNPHMLTEKAFYLFNTFRPPETLPDCVKQVKVLYQGERTEGLEDRLMEELWHRAMIEGYSPEGLICYDHATRTYVKYTFANQQGKWRNV